MHNRSKKDLCKGPIFTGMLMYALPIMATGILQVLYNAADTAVIGQFRGDESLAAVAATGSLTNLIVNLFLGLSSGVLTVVARHIGAKHSEKVHESVHTSMLISVVCGLFLLVVGVCCSGIFLTWMGTGKEGPEVLVKATTYMRIYFLGAPAFLVYNFGASVLRAAGDTKRPMIYLALSGILNVALNILLVWGCGMDVEGVAIATIASQYLSAVLVVICLLRETGDIRLHVTKLRFHRAVLGEILRMGIPAGVQMSLFSFSNVLIQSTINSFGPLYMAGNGAAAQVENMVYTTMGAFTTTITAYTSQNFGAHYKRRISRTFRSGILLQLIFCGSIGILLVTFSDQLLRVFTNNPAALAAGRTRMLITSGLAVLAGVMDAFPAFLRGLGLSVVPMVTTLGGVCGLRVVWIFTVLPYFEGDTKWFMLFLCYPVSWFVTIVAHVICSIIFARKVLHNFTDQEPVKA